MGGKPTTAQGYPAGLAEEARRMALYVATILGDLAEDVVIVGGLVPYLIIDQEQAIERHVGTRDLDLGLSIGVLNQQRYREISERLRDRGFEPATNDRGNRQRQTWRLPEERIALDFLIGPVDDDATPGELQPLEGDFAAIVTAVLPLAFVDTVLVTLDGSTTTGERARRTIQVAGPAAFVALKAHAFRGRGENKDAYDLVYVLLHFGSEPIIEVAERFRAIADRPAARTALAILTEDFASEAHVGPSRRAEFLGDREDPELRQDAAGAVLRFLDRVRQQT
jgi:hypothetical protein